MLKIAMKCYLVLSGVPQYVSGYQVQELVGERIRFEYLAGTKQVVLNENDCRYLEDPVAAYSKYVRELDTANKLPVKAGSPAIEPIPAEPEPEKEWCLVDGYEQRHCNYGSMSECIKAMHDMPKTEYRYCTHRDYAPYRPKQELLTKME